MKCDNMIFDRTKFYCKNGEIVYVSTIPENASQINVYYKDNWYLRPKSAIGTTLFFDDPTKKSKKKKNKKSNIKNNSVKNSTKSNHDSIKESIRYADYNRTDSNKVPEKQCSNCQDYVGGRCSGHKTTCEDYRYAPTVKEEWPDHMGYFIPYNKK